MIGVAFIILQLESFVVMSIGVAIFRLSWEVASRLQIQTNAIHNDHYNFSESAYIRLKSPHGIIPELNLQLGSLHKYSRQLVQPLFRNG